MTATTTDRQTIRRERGLVTLPIAAGTEVINGTIACVNANGYAVEGATATNLVYMGRFESTVDNTDGADGDLAVNVRTPAADAFLWDNDTANPVTQAMLGTKCYILDNQTVTANATGNSLAGVVVEVTSEGVWVE